MNPLRLQACVLIVLSVPFAVLGFRHSDWAAWATAPLRVVDVDKMRKEFAAIEARQAVLTHDGQKLLARIRPTSKYYGQGVEGTLFPVCIGPAGEYCVLGGPGGQYRLLLLQG